MTRQETTDYLAALGTLALASRLRRLLGRLSSDGTRIYAELHVTFEVRWFPVLHLLGRHAPRSVTEIAASLGLSHPAVVQVTGQLVEQGLVVSRPSPTDRRVKLLALSRKGRGLVTRLEPVWQAFAAAGRELATEGGNDLLAAIGKAEAALDRRSLHDRVTTHRALVDDAP